MKKLALCLMMLSLGLFSVGCGETTTEEPAVDPVAPAADDPAMDPADDAAVDPAADPAVDPAAEPAADESADQ